MLFVLALPLGGILGGHVLRGVRGLSLLELPFLEGLREHVHREGSTGLLALELLGELLHRRGWVGDVVLEFLRELCQRHGLPLLELAVLEKVREHVDGHVRAGHVPAVSLLPRLLAEVARRIARSIGHGLRVGLLAAQVEPRLLGVLQVGSPLRCGGLVQHLVQKGSGEGSPLLCQLDVDGGTVAEEVRLHQTLAVHGDGHPWGEPAGLGTV